VKNSEASAQARYLLPLFSDGINYWISTYTSCTWLATRSVTPQNMVKQKNGYVLSFLRYHYTHIQISFYQSKCTPLAIYIYFRARFIQSLILYVVTY
jgi:hypothetical protein